MCIVSIDIHTTNGRDNEACNRGLLIWFSVGVQALRFVILILLTMSHLLSCTLAGMNALTKMSQRKQQRLANRLMQETPNLRRLENGTQWKPSRLMDSQLKWYKTSASAILEVTCQVTAAVTRKS